MARYKKLADDRLVVVNNLNRGWTARNKQIEALKNEVKASNTRLQKHTSTSETELARCRKLADDRQVTIINLDRCLTECESQVQVLKNVVKEQKSDLTCRNNEIDQLKNELNQPGMKDALIVDLQQKIEQMKNSSTSNVLSSQQATENDNLKTQLLNTKSKLEANKKEFTKQCKTLSSRNNEIKNLKGQISNKDKELLKLRKQVEDQQKKIGSQASNQAGLQKTFDNYKKQAESTAKSSKEKNENQKTEIRRLNNCLQAKSEETKQSDARLEMVLKSGEVDVVSVHLVAQIYELYKQKADQLKELTQPAGSKEVDKIIASKPVEKQIAIEREAGDGDSEPTVSLPVEATTKML